MDGKFIQWGNVLGALGVTFYKEYKYVPNVTISLICGATTQPAFTNICINTISTTGFTYGGAGSGFRTYWRAEGYI